MMMAEGIQLTEDQREIRRKKRVLECAEKLGNINKKCRRFEIARLTFYLWRDRYRELGEARLAPDSQTGPLREPVPATAAELS
jgi:transposase-like protein